MREINLARMYALVAVLCMIFSCNKSSDVNAPSSVNSVPLRGKLAVQLQLAKENLQIQKIDASIISYNLESELKDDNQVSALRQKLVAEENFVPEFDGSNAASFNVSTIKERMLKYRKDPNEEQNIVQNLQQQVFPILKVGQKVLTILWNANGKQFKSLCVYNDEGIVYDNMLSNIVLAKATAAIDEVKLSSASLKTNTAQRPKQYSFTSTVRDVTIKWLWGGTRGKVVIKHYIIWNGSNYIYDHGGSVDAWMSVGAAMGRWANNYLNRRSRSKMAWGYGWATPTASFSIKFNSKSITFSATTSGVGSKGSGDGIHTIYL
ncbi:hypothetical protein [Segetibacter koreensis]|uniref:hypothetical protein n=1 Tax=Segetibacter koreensis TaxID=398037 RepID=UPI0003744157|nr:hypothetical protein [Segetibacter koreensis]